mmetsp:Transcript_8673/g.39430  ORF Transcript_8673/g.39430 Transcript_8673/m.39430 type:complete len:288 (-) Transcript_8673:2061-2924(-)
MFLKTQPRFAVFRGASHGPGRAPAHDVHGESGEIFSRRRSAGGGPRGRPRDPHRLHAVPWDRTSRGLDAVHAPGRDAPLVLGGVHVRVGHHERLRDGIFPVFRYEFELELGGVEVQLHRDDVGEDVEGVARGAVAVDGVPDGGFKVPFHAIDAERDAKVRGFPRRDDLRRRARVLQLQRPTRVHVHQNRPVVVVRHGEELEVIAQHGHLPKVQRARAALELGELLRDENPGALLHLNRRARNSLVIRDDAEPEQLVILGEALRPVHRPTPSFRDVRVQPQWFHRIGQ